MLAALDDGDKSVMVQGQLIPLSIHPTIITAENWFSQERDRLRIHGMTRCKRCLQIKSIRDRCGCYDKDKDQIETPFTPKLPPAMAKRLAEISGRKLLK